MITRCDPLKERLRLFLVWLAHKFGQPVEKGLQITFRLTHQEIADAIGSSRVSVTRLLRILEQQGVILRFGSKIVVKGIKSGKV